MNATDDKESKIEVRTAKEQWTNYECEELQKSHNKQNYDYQNDRQSSVTYRH